MQECWRLVGFKDIDGDGNGGDEAGGAGTARHEIGQRRVPSNELSHNLWEAQEQQDAVLLVDVIVDARGGTEGDASSGCGRLYNERMSGSHA